MDTAIRLIRQPFSRFTAAAPQPESIDLEAGAAASVGASKSVLGRTTELTKEVLHNAEQQFLARSEPLTGTLFGLHTLSMVAREAIPAYVAAPAVGIAGSLVKLGASLGGAHGLKLTRSWSAEALPLSEHPTTYDTLLALLPATAGVGLTLAALGAFPVAEGAALTVGAIGQLVQSAVEARGSSRRLRNMLSIACMTAVLLVREGAFNASSNPLPQHTASPYMLSAAACNGAAQNCAAQWCDVVFPATHNSMMQPTPFAKLQWPFNQLGRFASNQARSVEQQFDDGIRGFLIEYYQNDDGELRTSHNTVFDREPLVKTLGRFATLLAAHPRDFIALQISQQQKGDYEDKLIDVYRQSGLAAFTMQDTCQKNSQSAIKAPPCNLSMGSLLDLGVQVATITSFLQNTYSASTLSGLSCAGETDWRGAKFEPVTWNAFVSLAMPTASGVVNGYLPNFVAKCATEGPSDINTPTLLAVNHYESSDVVAIAHALNTQSFKRTGDAAVCGVALEAG